MNSIPAGKSKLVCYSSEQIPEVWDQIAPHIKNALDRGSNYTLYDIEDGLLKKEMQVWCWQDTKIHGALVTTILNKDGIRFLLFLALGGSKIDEWIGYLSIVEDWAKEKGCEEARIYGRHGWARHIGYDVNYTKMTRIL